MQEKKDRKKKPRLEKSVEEEEDDDDFEFVVDKFDDGDDFIPFEDEDEKVRFFRSDDDEFIACRGFMDFLD